MRCDTCKKEVKEVMRVIVYKDYDRSLARPIYNCPECFAKKEKSKPYTAMPTPPKEPSTS